MSDAPPQRADGRLTVALVSEVFWEPDGLGRLDERLDEAARRGADLAVLPELPLHPWRPATRDVLDEDAEPMGGPRSTAQADAARRAGIGVVGGIIHRDETGRRTSRAVVFDRAGNLVGAYEKLHLPEQEGFWETSHYEPGVAAPHPMADFGLPIGLQLCSDTNRPEGSLLLGAMGAEAILIPRATKEATYQRWKLVFRAIAMTSATYVLSVNRPYPEQGVLLGGASVAVDPTGYVVVETTDRLALVTIDHAAVEAARRDYPGYLPIRAEVYAAAWAEVAAAATEARTPLPPRG